ncbi:antibiotic biosynthesis monooxygenase family protein [Kitasatospora sp. NPDC051984]|uniref:antibiotic biosynthesis monooxygenase family protein n=1 Tax=Kitasatospora sp. NPDC051984 TaxID=3364059 RepID=UPI0037C9CBE6
MTDDQTTDRPITVVATFTLKGDAAEFEQLLAEQAELMRAGDGFELGVLARSTTSPDTYVNLAWWRDSQSYLSVVRSYAFAAKAMSELPRLADARIDRFVPTADHGTLLPADGAEQGVLVLAVHAADESAAEQVEAGWAAHTGQLTGQEGFLGAALGRSEVRPGGHGQLGWWRDEAAAAAAPGYRAEGTETLVLRPVHTVSGRTA